MTDVQNEDDFLYGVVAIAAYLGISPRKAHHLKDCHGLPTFKIGSTVCSRPASLRAWLSEQERATGGKRNV